MWYTPRRGWSCDCPPCWYQWVVRLCRYHRTPLVCRGVARRSRCLATRRLTCTMARHLLTPTELQPLQTEEHAALPDEVHLLQPNNVLRVGAGGVHIHTARMVFGRGLLSVRKYGHSYIEEVMGGSSWALNVPGRDFGLRPSVEASSGGDVQAVGYGTNACSQAAALTSGCLDGWGWRYDWLNWEKQDDHDVVPYRRKQQKGKKKGKKKKKRKV